MVLLNVSASWQSRRGFNRKFALKLGLPVGFVLTVFTAINML